MTVDVRWLVWVFQKLSWTINSRVYRMVQKRENMQIAAVSYGSRRPHHMLLLSAKSQKSMQQFTLVHQNWTTDDWKNTGWSGVSQFLLWHLHRAVRIWHKQHEIMDPSCFALRLQTAGDVTVWGYFFGTLWALEFHLNTTASLSIVADHAHSCINTVYPPSAFFQQDNSRAALGNSVVVSFW